MTHVNHVRRGSGSPLVLLHGLGSRWQAYEPIIDTLAATHEVIAVDLPGFGETPQPDGFEPSAPAYATWLAEWLESIGITRPHVVGNSMGGGVALEFARLGRAAAVTVFSPIGFWRTPGRLWAQWLATAVRVAGRLGGRPFEMALRFMPFRTLAAAPIYGHPGRLPVADLRGDLRAYVGATGFEAARDSYPPYHFSDGPTLEHLPITVAWGTRDVLLTYPTQSRRARRLLPHATHVTLKTAGHVPFNDDPRGCVGAITRTSQAREGATDE